MTTVSIYLPQEQGGVQTYSIELFQNGTPINAGGSTLTEKVIMVDDILTATGFFEASISNLSKAVPYFAVVKKNGVYLTSGWLDLRNSATVGHPTIRKLETR